MNPVLDTKDPAEKAVITLDATQLLNSGETLTSIVSTTVTRQAGSGTDTPTLSVTASINTTQLSVHGNVMAIGSAVQVVASAGTDGSQYLINVLCNTSNVNKTVALKAILPVSTS